MCSFNERSGKPCLMYCYVVNRLLWLLCDTNKQRDTKNSSMYFKAQVSSDMIFSVLAEGCLSWSLVFLIAFKKHEEEICIARTWMNVLNQFYPRVVMQVILFQGHSFNSFQMGEYLYLYISFMHFFYLYTEKT